MSKRLLWFCCWAMLWLGAAACSQASSETPVLSSEVQEEMEAVETISVSSPAFEDGERIPDVYTCSGENSSPALSWSGAPGSTASLVLIMDDPDAPSGTFVHWVLFNLDPSLTELPQGILARVGSGTAGTNSARKLGYTGPCPPPGKPHRYFFKLYALDTPLDLPEGATKADVEQAMQGHILAHGQFMGTFSR